MAKSVQFTGVVLLTDLPLTFIGCFTTFPDPAKVGEMKGKSCPFKYLSTALFWPTTPYKGTSWDSIIQLQKAPHTMFCFHCTQGSNVTTAGTFCLCRQPFISGLGEVMGRGRWLLPQLGEESFLGSAPSLLPSALLLFPKAMHGTKIPETSCKGATRYCGQSLPWCLVKRLFLCFSLYFHKP